MALVETWSETTDRTERGSQVTGLVSQSGLRQDRMVEGESNERTSVLGLRILLQFLASIEAIAGITLIFASKWVLSLTAVDLSPPDTYGMLLLLKAGGIIGTAFAYLLFRAGSDPVRYIAVIDALIFMLSTAAILNLYALLKLHIGLFSPPPFIITRALFQCFLAAVFVALRPRGVAGTTISQEHGK
ncbi:MAG TPA: hypothetical protein VGZ00_05110 [Candidatus Baltobacteraceae bacterium]|nr:hypothetical protein [Candidatus Baltobacteraceae bacterium]